MDRQTFNSAPEKILDLGTGFSNIHLNISEVEMTEMNLDGTLQNVTKHQADVVRVANPVTRDKVVSVIIKDRFTIDFREAALRKGVINKDDSDYVLFNDYAELVKQMCTEAGIE